MVRITQNLLAHRTLFNLQSSLERMAQLQNQLSTGRRINRPSDDPVDFPRDLAIRTDISVNRRLRANIDAVNTDLELTESALNSTTNLMQRARELAVQAGNNTSLESRVAISQEIGEIFQQLADLSNTNIGGVFIFAGSETTTKPFVVENGAATYRGDDVTRKALIGSEVSIGTNMTGTETFLHQQNEITASVRIADPTMTLLDSLQLANPSFAMIPEIPDEAGGPTSPSPNQNNNPVKPANFATFSIYGEDVSVDLTVDTLEDLVERINTTVRDVDASISSDGRMILKSKRSSALELRDGPSNPGFPPSPTFGSNVLSALGMYHKIQDQRDLDSGFPAADPLAAPGGTRSYVEVRPEVVVLGNANAGPPRNPNNPFPDNMALTDLSGNLVTKLEGIRITLDNDTFDINLGGITLGSAGADALVGTADDIPGSTVQDILDVINNDPRLQGRAHAYIDDDGSGIGITSTQSADTFKVENVTQIFGHDITTRVQDVAGVPTYTRVGPIDEYTLLSTLPGALINAAGTDSTGIRQTPSAANPTNAGLITIVNGTRRAGVDLSSALNIGDVLRAINNADAGVEAKINPSGTGLTIERIDTSTGPLSVQDISLGTLSRDLGIFSAVQPRTVSAVTGGPTTTLGAAGAVAGTWDFEVHDHAGQVLDTYKMTIDPLETFEDFASRLDALDGASGPGGGLFSADMVGNNLVISSNYNGNTLFIDSAQDTSNLVTSLSLDAPTLVNETEVQTPASTIFPIAVNQETASILGLGGTGAVTEVQEQNVFKTFRDLQAALLSDDNKGISDALGAIDTDLEVILNSRTVVGARINRLDATKTRLEDSEVFQRQELSILEDADLAELISDLTTQETAFNAALAASSRVIQPSLMDYLR